jgi:hypothetical protein
VSTTEGLLERKSSGSGLEIREYGLRDPLCWPRNTLYPQTLALSSPTRSGHSVGIVRSRTKATEFVFILSPAPAGCSHPGSAIHAVFLADYPVDINSIVTRLMGVKLGL